jgi:16S rRNA (guanine527-N7)-methyltransferase
MPLPDLMKIVKKNISRKDQINSLPNGVIVLKGGDVQAEIQPFKRICEVLDIDMWFNEEWFKGKHIIYVPV